MSQSDTHSSSSNLLPGPILLLGAPGVGKGTQAKLLMAAWSIPQISTGDLLRDHRTRWTELGMLADGLMREGKLVPDDLVNDMVADRLRQPDCARGYILDGYPRTLGQAEWLDAHLARQPRSLPVVAVSILVDHDALLKRITGRRMSPAGRIYNIYSSPSRVEGVCDVDGSTLIQRADDTEQAFEQRMHEFRAKTEAVIEHYRERDSFAEVDGSAAVEEVATAVRGALETLRAKVSA